MEDLNKTVQQNRELIASLRVKLATAEERYRGLEEYLDGIAITKREHFASLAMQGFLACSDISISARDIIKESVRYADNLIKHLKDTEPAEGPFGNRSAGDVAYPAGQS